jgi:hypothetical protein
MYCIATSNSLYVLQRPSSNTSKSVCGARTDLADYSNKQWGGLVGSYYPGRYKCYTDLAAIAFAMNPPQDVNDSAYNSCIDNWSWEWQHDFGGVKHPICWAAVGDAVAISKELIAKYSPIKP